MDPSLDADGDVEVVEQTCAQPFSTSSFLQPTLHGSKEAWQFPQATREMPLHPIGSFWKIISTFKAVIHITWIYMCTHTYNLKHSVVLVLYLWNVSNISQSPKGRGTVNLVMFVKYIEMLLSAVEPTQK